MPRSSPSTSSRSLPAGNKSSIGTISGGSAMILRSPSTSWVSLANACMLSLVRALATFARAFARCFLVAMASQLLEQRLDLDVGVPDVEIAHRGGLLHPRPVLRGHRPARPRAAPPA